MAPVAEAVGLFFGGIQACSNTAQAAIEYSNLPNNIEDVDDALIHDALSQAVSLVCSKKKDLENEILQNKTKVPSEVCKQWILQVTKTEKDAGKLLKKDSDQIKKESSSFLSSHFSWGSDVKDEMKQIYKKVLHLLDQTKATTETLLVDAPPEPVVHMSTPDIKKFPTLQKELEKIICLLRNVKDKGIKIQGIVGIGKTTIMLNLNNHKEVAEMFDVVICLTVSVEGSNKNLSMVHLQQEIVKRLKLKMESTSDACVVKERIRLELKDRKYLLLLDDVKEDLKLHEIGIPDGKDGSNIVITTRKDHVCCSIMKKVIKVTYLTEYESWKMFRDVLGKTEGVGNRKIVPIARRVCRECYGLPLVIKQVANIFKLKKDCPSVWKEGLDSWRYWTEKDKEGMRELYAMLKFSYDELDDDDRKKCFLYSALYPNDKDIRLDYLLESWAAEEFLNNDHDPKKLHVMIKGGSILNHLKNVSLLEEGKTENHVKAQKFMRQVALFISGDDVKCKHVVLTSIGLEKPPDVKSWTGMNRISLSDNKLDKLPDSPDCPMLSTLFLQRNLCLKQIPKSFFEHMKSLKVLDLSDTGIELLPSSLSTLINLEVLYLNNCEKLVELTHVMELRNLEVLDIQGSGIRNMPPHIEKLICLRCLRVSIKFGNQNAAQEVYLNYNIISELSKLEELVIDVESPQQWSSEVQEKVINIVVALKEFKTLRICFPDGKENVIEVTSSSTGNITTLNACVCEDAMILCFIENNPLLDLSRIESFEIFIGCKDSKYTRSPKFHRYEKYIKYCNGTQGDFPNSKLLLESEAFELVNHFEIEQLSDIEVASMNRVQGCIISSCGAMENIVGIVNTEVLPELEHLYLENLIKMKQIWTGLMPPGSFAKLETLVLTQCPMLVHVFPIGMIQQVWKIKCLKIEQCERVEEIILKSDANGNTLGLPQLEKLILIQMQNLKGICANELLAWPSLEKLKIYNCEKLCKLPFTKNNATKLEHIEVEKQWWDGVECQNEDVKEHLSQFCIYRS